jgi:BirA family biotin operon repressor/biotin-[acetyl-CoA-carboxylase] ligase
MKSHILDILRTAPGRVSGETLSDRLKISRVSIWKHIQALTDKGYDIEASAKGYRLLESPDIPYPWEFPDREAHMHYFDTLDSTMDKARDLALNGHPHLTCVVAGTQRKGRGRMRRTWRSHKGGLYFTVITRPVISPVQSARVGFAAALAVNRCLHRLHDLPAQVKWPNDILVEDRKICGILSEMAAEGETVTHVNLGIGLNVNNDPTRTESTSVSIKKLTGKRASCRALLSCFLTELEDLTDDLLNHRLIDEWRQHSATLGREVKIVTLNQTIEGRAVDIDENGALMVAAPDGATVKALFGDCFIKG